jgi:hypothetical protein
MLGVTTAYALTALLLLLRMPTFGRDVLNFLRDVRRFRQGH